MLTVLFGLFCLCVFLGLCAGAVALAVKFALGNPTAAQAVVKAAKGMM